MLRRRSSGRLGNGRLGWVALALTLAGVAAAEEPARWLERMNQALSSRNYDGTFAHWHGGRVEMLRIIHRVQDGAVSERLVSLDGSGREFIRTGSDLACYLPDKKTVLVERRPVGQSLLSGFPVLNPQTASFYDIRETGQSRVNRRDTHMIAVLPKDRFRYGYRLWIDETTAMPLKTQLCDAGGHVIEQIVFADLRMTAHIPDADFRPDVSTDGFQWLRNDSPPVDQTADSAGTDWNETSLPPGFRMTARSAQMMPGSSDPVSHLVFTDGLASVSVFVENHPNTDPPNQQSVSEESVRLGSSSVFSTTLGGRKVTAVGEVPPETVRSIASSFTSGGAQPLNTVHH